MKKIFVLLAALLLTAGCCRTAEVRYSEEDANDVQATPIVVDEDAKPEAAPLPETLPPLPERLK